MSLASVIKRVPDLGMEFREFVVAPRSFAHAFKDPALTNVPAKEVLAWSLAACFLLFSLYSLLFGSISTNLTNAAEINSQESEEEPLPSGNSHPEIRGVRWELAFGVGIFFPEARAFSQPQLANFQMGAVEISIDHVRPDDLTNKGIATLMLMLFAFVTVLCLHLPALLSGGKGTVYDATRFGIVYYSYVCLFASLLAVLFAILLIHLFHLRGITLLIAWTIFVLLPSAIVTLRDFFVAFSEFYSISKKKLFLAGIGSTIVSCVVSPLVFLPGVYLVIWLKPLWDAVL